MILKSISPYFKNDCNRQQCHLGGIILTRFRLIIIPHNEYQCQSHKNTATRS